MKAKTANIRNILSAVLIFFVFTTVFTFFRRQISSFAAWCLAVTGEVDLLKSISYDPENAAGGAVTEVKQQPKKDVPAARSFDATKPVVANLPKTATPEMIFSKGVFDFNDSKIPAFPDLRLYTGAEWNKEKTVIKMATDGDSLYFFFMCYDKDTANLVTEYTEKEGAVSSYKDDGIEIFLMKDRNAKFYYQMAVSVSGCYSLQYFKIREDYSRMGTKMDRPSFHEEPDVSVAVLPDGYKVEVRISLADLEIEKLGKGNEILAQLVRNYRGQKQVNENLQLFPCFIYADCRFGEMNHDHRAFQPIKVVE